MMFPGERPFSDIAEVADRVHAETRLEELKVEHGRVLEENRALRRRLGWMSGTLLCMVLPCGLVALFAVGNGLYPMAALMAFIGALCWVGGCLATEGFGKGEHDG